MTDEEAAALVAAGRLLQAKSWPYGRRKIERRPGEKYPQAVLRVIKTLPEGERAHLRKLVAWVRSFERCEQTGGR